MTENLPRKSAGKSGWEFQRFWSRCRFQFKRAFFWNPVSHLCSSSFWLVRRYQIAFYHDQKREAKIATWYCFIYGSDFNLWKESPVPELLQVLQFLWWAGEGASVYSCCNVSAFSVNIQSVILTKILFSSVDRGLLSSPLRPFPTCLLCPRYVCSGGREEALSSLNRADL